MRHTGRSVFAPGYSAPPHSLVDSAADWAIKKENDPLQYYTAPMEGLTDRIWRQAHQRWFGAPGAPARYYAPFLSPPENRVRIKKMMAELDPAANPGAPVIPQLLAKDGALAAWMVTELRRLGYTEVNLNFGCPSGTVTAKGKGAGMLRDPAKLEAFLDEFFSRTEGPVSV